MQIYEITGFRTGVQESGVNFLSPADSYQYVQNGFIYRQILQSRLGFNQFANRLGNATIAVPAPHADATRVMGIFENILPTGDHELLVITKKYLYKYNTGNGEFDQIPFNARILGLVPNFNFAIVSNEDYISGTTYLTKTNAQRFVFTGKSIAIAPGGGTASAIYFYNGTDIGDFFSVVDNPDVQEPSVSLGNVVRARYVIWFGERLNFFRPQTTVAQFDQGILYSGIRDLAGNGDKFNVPGAGLLSCDTFEQINGAVVMGDVVAMNLQRSNWILEKTRDVFNPYFVRKIPSVIGTDAPYSSVFWGYEVKSIGKTGFISTDGRTSLRFDDKLPYFTRDSVNNEEFELTYGGFDRWNNQFLFSYRKDNSNLADVTQDSVVTYNYEEESWAINNMRFSVFGQAQAGINLTWNDIDENHQKSWLRMDTTDDVWDKIGVTAETQKTLAGDNRGFVYQLDTQFNDYYSTVTNITNANPCVITVSESSYDIGDEIVLYGVEGMTQINGRSLVVTARTDTLITINLDTSDLSKYSAYTGNGSLTKFINFFVQTNPFNPFREEGRKVYVSHVELLLDKFSGEVNMDVLQDEMTAPFIGAILEPDDTSRLPRQWITMSVNQEANFLTFVIYNKSITSQTLIYSMRIHCERGGLTTA
jgi:hypothetical protein